jgi:hypothetical protein
VGAAKRLSHQPLAQEIAKRSRWKHVTLETYNIFATPYDDLCKKYSDGPWDREKYAARHILFLERSGGYDYMERIFREQKSRC